MKHLLLAMIFVIPSMIDAQGLFFNENKPYNFQQGAVLIPSFHFGYAMQRIEFIAKNNGFESIETDQILPEIYLGCQLLSDGWMVGIHYGFLQKSILLGAGILIPISIKKRQ